MRNLKVDGDRLWATLMEMAKIGATEKGGNCRARLVLDSVGLDVALLDLYANLSALEAETRA